MDLLKEVATQRGSWETRGGLASCGLSVERVHRAWDQESVRKFRFSSFFHIFVDRGAR